MHIPTGRVRCRRRAPVGHCMSRGKKEGSANVVLAKGPVAIETIG